MPHVFSRYDYYSKSHLIERGYVIFRLPTALVERIDDIFIDTIRDLVTLNDNNSIFQDEKKMSTWRFMTYLGTNFRKAEAISKMVPKVSIENIKHAVSLLAEMVDFITTKDFFKVSLSGVKQDYLRKEHIAASLIHSFVGGPPQKTHWDYSPQDVVQFQEDGPPGLPDYESCDEFLPFIGLVFTADESFFEIFTNSHKTTRGVEGKASRLAKKLRIQFRKGDVIIFHPLLLHNGAEQIHINTRIHFYFDTPDLPRKTFKDGSTQTFMYDNRFDAETKVAKKRDSETLSSYAKTYWADYNASKRRKLDNFAGGKKKMKTKL